MRDDETQPRLQSTAANAGEKIQFQQRPRPEPFLDKAPEEPQTDSVAQQVPEINVQKLEGNELPDETLFQSISAQSEIIDHPLAAMKILDRDLLRREANHHGDQKRDRGA